MEPLCPRIVLSLPEQIPPLAGTDGHQKRVGNLILLSLPRREFTLLFSSLELVRLKLHQVMHETGEVIRSAYFNLILRARVHLFSPLLLNLACYGAGLGFIRPDRNKLTVLGMLTFKAIRANASIPSRHRRARIPTTERSIGLTCCTSLGRKQGCIAEQSS